jgi:hypothetical protein
MQEMDAAKTAQAPVDADIQEYHGYGSSWLIDSSHDDHEGSLSSTADPREEFYRYIQAPLVPGNNFKLLPWWKVCLPPSIILHNVF